MDKPTEFKFLTPMEEKIYDIAGGGEMGEIAVKVRREYLSQHKDWLRQELRECARMRYLPHSEKENGTLPILSEGEK